MKSRNVVDNASSSIDKFKNKNWVKIDATPSVRPIHCIWVSGWRRETITFSQTSLYEINCDPIATAIGQTKESMEISFSKTANVCSRLAEVYKWVPIESITSYKRLCDLTASIKQCLRWRENVNVLSQTRGNILHLLNGSLFFPLSLKKVKLSWKCLHFLNVSEWTNTLNMRLLS